MVILVREQIVHSFDKYAGFFLARVCLLPTKELILGDARHMGSESLHLFQEDSGQDLCKGR